VREGPGSFCFCMFAFKKKEKDGKRGGGERENRKMRK
jgi:hypothetical protein